MPAIRKRQPLARTIVTEFRVTVADVHLRKKALGGSIAKKVDLDTDFISGDAICTPDAPFVIEDVRTAVMVHSFRNVKIALTIGGVTTPPTLCSGLFVFYGAVERIEISTDEATERFSYVRS